MRRVCPKTFEDAGGAVRTRTMTKYRDLSTTAAKAPPPVEMTFFRVELKRTSRSKDKSKGNRRSFDFTSRKCARCSAQDDTSWVGFEENTQRQEQLQRKVQVLDRFLE